MKDQFLRLAGVKSDKEFYKLFPDEASFMAKYGKQVKKLQMGSSIPNNKLAQIGSFTGGEKNNYNPVNYQDVYDDVDYSVTGSNKQIRMDEANLFAQQEIAKNSNKKNGLFDMLGQFAGGLDALSGEGGGEGVADAIGEMRYGGHIQKAENGFMQNFGNKTEAFGQKVGQGYDKVDAGLGKIGGVAGGIGVIKDLTEGIQMIKAEKNQRNLAEQSYNLSNLTRQASQSIPEQTSRNYLRPEDQIFNSGEMNQQLGVGTNVLARSGANVPKAMFGMDKMAGQAGNQFGSLLFGGKGQPTGAGQVGSTIGSVAGKLIPIPGADIALSAVGGLVGSAIGAKGNRDTERYNTGAERNLLGQAFEQGARGAIGQYSDFAEYGTSVPNIDNFRIGGKIQKAQRGLSSIYKKPESGYISGGNTPEDIARQSSQMQEYGASYVPKEQINSFMENWNNHRGSVKDVYNKFNNATPDQFKNMSMEEIWKARFDAKKLNSKTYNNVSDEEQLANSQIITDQTRGMRSNYLPEEEAIYNFHKAQKDSVENSYNKFNKLSNEQMLQKEKESGLSQLELDAKYKQLFKLRTGGNISQENMAMGGDLKTHWGGYAEPISYNHHLPNNGETVMFRGKSHEESDGKGRKGIGITYGDSPVEVERGEPAVQLENGGDAGENSLTVYGNLKIPKYGAEMLGDSKAAGKKFKNYVADLSRTEKRQNSIIDKASTELEDLDDDSSFGLLSLEAIKANMLGANMKLKDIADKKIKAASLQSAINDTAEEFDLVADDLAKGKVKQAKKGASIKKAQAGATALPSVDVNDESLIPIRRPDFSIKVPQSVSNLQTAEAVAQAEEDEFNLIDLANQVIPYLRPTDAEALNPNQLAGEMFALATNQLEPVQAQTFQPQLSTPYDISLQDILNRNQADYRAAQRMVGYNPAALAALNAQKYSANQQVLGEQFRMNQGMRDRVFAENRNLLNQSNLQNLGIYDQQYQRQQQALSNTKATTQAALNSISAKYAQNQLENRNLQTYENLYNFRFDPRFRAMNINPLAQFNFEGSGMSGMSGLENMSPEDLKFMAAQKEYQEKKIKKTKDKNARNGSIVKAIKSM